ncbi:hypothetical protein C1645_776828 [Glomus cerebriforme]|uniref:Uncharacterized protein n=1 Tax=Glomus cerebriforme TaxID=658196 RepID=A0A397SRW0_9GLOM|nr:hypothetical protein C1645_776828 [Glomus cerebriforme]
MTRLRKNLGIGASTSSTPTLPPQHNYGLDNLDKNTPSQLLNDMLSSQSSLLGYGTDEEGNMGGNNTDYTRRRDLSDSETSDDGAKEIYDSDEISSIGSDDNMITDESSYLGSSFQSSDSEEMTQEIDEDAKGDKKGSRYRKYEQNRNEVMQSIEMKEMEKKTNVRRQSKGKERLRDSSKRKLTD